MLNKVIKTHYTVEHYYIYDNGGSTDHWKCRKVGDSLSELRKKIEKIIGNRKFTYEETRYYGHEDGRQICWRNPVGVYKCNGHKIAVLPERYEEYEEEES